MDDLPIIQIDSPDPEPDDTVIRENESDTNDSTNNIFISSVDEPTNTEQPDMLLEPEPVKKRKKPLSDKQRLHLSKARAKAQEKAKTKRELKQAVEAKVQAEIKKAEPPPKLAPPPHQLTEEFKERMNIPSEEDKIKTKREKEEKDFFEFHAKMKQYNAFEAYLKKEALASRTPTPVPTPVPTPISPPKPKPLPPQINNLIKPIPVNPYDKMFDWS